MDNKALANLLFPDIDKAPQYYEDKYPERDLPKGARLHVWHQALQDLFIWVICLVQW